jgi:hypothetical protein
MTTEEKIKGLEHLLRKRTVRADRAPSRARSEKDPGCIYQINDHFWEGSFYPRLPNGKHKKFNVYAETKEQCETKLAEMIERVKSEFAEEKAKIKGRRVGALNGWYAVNKEYLIVRFCQNSIVFLLS